MLVKETAFPQRRGDTGVSFEDTNAVKAVRDLCVVVKKFPFAICITK